MPIYENPEDIEDTLTRLLVQAAPVNEFQRRTLSGLATALGITRWSVHKWIINQKLSPDRVVDIVRISEGRVKIEDFHPFVYKT